MKSKFLTVVAFTILLTHFCSAQSKYFIQFTDRNNNPFSISNPTAYLSQRAMDRRIAQGIPVQENDLPVNPDYVDSLISKGATILTKSKWFNGVTIFADVPTLQAVLTLPFVIQSVPVQKPAPSSPDPLSQKNKFDVPLRNQAEDLLRISSFNYGNSYSQIHIMNGDYLHDLGYHGENKIIALLDAGFFNVDVLPVFDSMRTNNQILATWDFVANDASVYEDNWHGMMVLSTIAGNVPGQLVGTAPKASFLLLRTEEVASEFLIEEYNWDAGAEYADSAGADVISSSLGYTTFNDPSQDHTYSDMNGHTNPSTRAANIAFSKGILVVVSAGNEGSSTFHYISSPADADSALTVGAVNNAGNYAFFSSTGPSSDGDIKPNVAGVGQGTVISSTNGSITTGNGTSFSCPVLAGAATCFWQAFPSSTNKAIFNAIQQSASQHLTPDSLLGYGIPNFMISGMLLGGIDIAHSGDDKKLIVYPNPFERDVAFNFYSESDQPVTIRVMDVIGNVIFENQMEATARQYHTSVITLNNLQRGIYFLEVSSASGKMVSKITRL